MDLDEYQRQAIRTEARVHTSGADEIVPILGLAGETGELLNEYKKRLRDGLAHSRFPERVQEELGDILWYVAATAQKFGLKLSAVAAHNLEKTRSRWGAGGKSPLPPEPRIFDAHFPLQERFKRQFLAEFQEDTERGRGKIKVLVDGQQMGQELTDNAYVPDGYRFHDAFHLACVAVLGWSPVTRRNLGLKRRSDPKVDEIEDGGRAIVTEEGISALVFAHARDRNAFYGVKTVDYELLKAIRIMAAPFEVAVCTTGEWEHAILSGYRVWKKVEENRGGRVKLDLDERSIEYVGPI